jgi:hypothetical protein
MDANTIPSKPMNGVFSPFSRNRPKPELEAVATLTAVHPIQILISDFQDLNALELVAISFL